MRSGRGIADLMEARSVAIVGVGGGDFDARARSNLGRRFFENLVRHGYEGRIHAINPKYDEIAGYPCYPSVAAVPEPVEAALIALPQPAVRAAVEDCAAAGVGVAVVVAAGYRESGPAGRRAEEELVATAERLGVRLLGPNSFGVCNATTGLALFGSGMILDQELRAGDIALVAQSGALATSLVDVAHGRGLGFRHVITTGNQCDIDVVEALEYVVEDDAVAAVALFLEGVRDGARFRRVAQRARSLGKPLVVLKVGSSEQGRKATQAHTGSLAGDDAVFDAVARADAVVRVPEPGDLLEVAHFLARRPRRERGAAPSGSGSGTAILSLSGALAGILVDEADRLGVDLAVVGEVTTGPLAREHDLHMANPFDLGPVTFTAGFEIVGRVAELLVADPAVDSIVLALAALPYNRRLVDDVVAAVAGRLPLAVLWVAGEPAIAGQVEELAAQGVPVFFSTGAVMRAVAALSRCAGPAPTVPAPGGDDAAGAGPRADLEARPSGPLDEVESKAILAAHGLPVPREVVADSAEAAVEAFRALGGGPVALKIVSRRVPHKTDAGCVALDVEGDEAVRAGFEEIRANAIRAGATGSDGVLVSPMAGPGVELLVGLKVDATFGPVVVVGTGGIDTEVHRDVVLHPAPVGPEEADAMLSRLRSAALLDGARGRPVADRAAVVEVIVALGRLGVELGDLLDAVDVNPLVVHAAGAGATVVDALVVRA